MIIILLTYAIEVVHVSNRDEKRQLRFAYNSIFRKIFGYRWLESVTALQEFLGHPTWEQLIEKRQSSFHKRIVNGKDCLRRRLMTQLPFLCPQISCLFTNWFVLYCLCLMCCASCVNTKQINKKIKRKREEEGDRDWRIVVRGTVEL